MGYTLTCERDVNHVGGNGVRERALAVFVKVGRRSLQVPGVLTVATNRRAAGRPQPDASGTSRRHAEEAALKGVV